MQLYTNLPHTYASTLEAGMTEEPMALAANNSFKLASEVALMIVFLFQCYPRRLQETAEKLLPMMVKASFALRVQLDFLHH